MGSYGRFKALNEKTEARGQKAGAARVTRNDRASARRPGRGTGTDGSDLFEWQRPGEVVKVEDDRKGMVLCRKCKQPVTQVEDDGFWTNRDLETGFPHELTCEGP